MIEKELTTKLVIDLASLKGFGSQGRSGVPIDISPFSFLVLSDYSCAWNGFNNIITLPPSTTLRWELEGLGHDSGMMLVSEIKLLFKLIGCPQSNSMQFPEWKNIFECTENMFNPADGTLEIKADSFQLVLPGPNTLSASIKTIPEIKPSYNVIYSIYMNFVDGLGDEAERYFLKIDPLIKNNSNPPRP